MTITRRLALAFATAAPFTRSALAADVQDYREFAEGSAKAKLTVIEYGSLTCPHCAEFHNVAYPLLKKEYIDTGKVRFIFRDLPSDNLGLGAALLARCVPGERGKEMISLMFATQRTWVLSDNPLEHLTGHAKAVGLEGPSLEACLKNEAILKKIVEIREAALRDHKVQSTPTFFIGEDMKEMVEGSEYPPLKAAIDKHFS